MHHERSKNDLKEIPIAIIGVGPVEVAAAANLADPRTKIYSIRIGFTSWR